MMNKFWKIKNEAESEEPAELMLYGEISNETWLGDEVTPKQFADDIRTLGGKALNVHVNSLGGDVFAAQAIYSQLKAYPGAITMYIDGIAASAATIVTCAGDKVVMPSNALFMIHNPSAAFFDFYDAKALRKAADTLDTVKQTIVNVYKSRAANLSDTKLNHLMDNETWLTADEAKDMGFVDEVADEILVMDMHERVIVNSVSYASGKITDAMRKVLHPKMSDRSIFAENKKEDDKMPETQKIEQPVDVLAKERERVKALMDMKNGNEIANRMIDAAITNGDTAEKIKAYIDVLPKEEPKNEAEPDAGH